MTLTALTAISAAYGFTHIQAPHASAALMVSIRQEHAALLADALDQRAETEVPAAHGGTVRLTSSPATRGGTRHDEFGLAWIRPGQPEGAADSWPLELITAEEFGGHRALIATALRRSDHHCAPMRFSAWAGQTIVQAGTATLILHTRLTDLVRAAQDPWLDTRWTDTMRGVDLLDMGGEDGGMACWALRVTYHPQGWPERTNELLLSLSDLRRDPEYRHVTVGR